MYDKLQAQSFPATRCFPLDCDVAADGNYIISSFNGFDSDGCHVALWDRRKLQLVQFSITYLDVFDMFDVFDVLDVFDLALWD